MSPFDEVNKEERLTLCQQAVRRGFTDSESVIGCFTGIRLAAHGFDEELFAMATEGLQACRPLVEHFERMQAHLGLSPRRSNQDAPDRG